MRFSFFLAAIALFTGFCAAAQVHTTYLWHLEQPVYWPETSAWNPNEYQKAWESQYLKDHSGNTYSDGLQHPLNNISEIFGNDDRKAVYQYRAKDAVQSLTGFPEGGAQVNYSGCLMENVKSLADAGQMGYSAGWQNNFVTARGLTTSAGKPRMDITGFTMNHALSPLVSDKMLRRQIQAHRYLYTELFGTSPNYSKGYWPAECSFSERNIKALAEEGFEWSVVANSHLARTLSDYPLTFGTSGCNIDPPNKADIVTAKGNNWWNGQIDGRGGTFAAPYCYQAHKAKYVDPATGSEYKITVVPMCDLLSYQNGYATMGTGDIDAHIAPFDNPSQPSIVLLAHDGDNAWGGGYDYYMNSVNGFASAAAAKGYVPTTIQTFLSQHAVPESDVVHVEDGSWVNAANDWGHPQFINWNWPMYTSAYQFDPNGWTEDVRNWAVLVAAENRVQMAEDLQGSLDIAKIVHPSAASNNAEKAWHYLLPAYNSGYMYYGTSLDMEVKQSLACNKACSFANQIINANAGTDNTVPTVFIPQRYPYNPGGIGFGPNYAYKQFQNPSDFYVWTFAYDVSGVQSATLKYRLDNDGLNPLDNNDNETYAGGSGVQAWQSITMSYRDFPKGNVTGNADINFFILPDYIAGEYYAKIAGIAEKLVDYYVEVVDSKGNIAKTAIQHVYVGPTNTGGGGQTGVSWTPANPTKNDVITITEKGVNKGAKLHWGVTVNGTKWTSPNTAYWPAGSSLFNGTGPAVQSPMTGPDANGDITIQIGPFNNAAQAVTSVDFVIHYDNNTWNNNGGADFRIPVDNTSTSRNAPVTSAGSVSACEGTPVTIPLTVTGFSNIRSMALRLDYNPAAMTFSSHSNAAAALAGLTVTDNAVSSSLHSVLLSWSSASPVSLADGAKITDLNFNFISGTGSLTFNNTDNSGSDCRFTDENNAVMTDSPAAGFFTNAQVSSLNPGAAGTVSGPSAVCQGASAQAYSVEAVANATGYTWTLPAGCTIKSGNNTNSITVDFAASATSGNITVKGTNSCGNGTPASLPVTVNTAAAASVSIAASANPVCSGTPVTYTATPVNGGTPVFQWKKNGVNAGNNASIYTFTPANGDVITCEMTSSLACVTGSPATSNAVTMAVNSSPQAGISIAADVNPVCSGMAVTFTATPVNGGNPLYQWKKNGINAGTNAPTFTFTPANGDVVTCEMTSSLACVTGSPATSNAVTMAVNSSLQAGISIAADVNPVCSGMAVTFTATPVNGGNPLYQWKKNGISSGTNAPNFTFTPANGDVVTCEMTSSLACVTGSPATSNAVTMAVNSSLQAGISIAADVNPVCSGNAVVLTASSVNGGSPSFVWTRNGTPSGGNSAVYSFIPSNGDIVTCQMTSSLGCVTGSPATSNSITLAVTSLPASVTATATPNPVVAGTALTLTGSGTGATSWNWTGPNGFSSALQVVAIPAASAANAGTYQLIAANGQCAASPVFTQAVVVNPVAIAGIAAASMKIYPNPVAGSFTFEYSAPQGEKLLQLDLFDNTGKLAACLLKNSAATQYKELFDVHSLMPGLYSLVVRTQQGVYVLKMPVSGK